MLKRKMLLSALLLLLVISVTALAEEELSIYQILRIAEKVEMDNFTSVVKTEDLWTVTGTNPHNSQPCEVLINAHSGLIVLAKNITPMAIILGENIYEYSGAIYPHIDKFYKTDLIYNGLEIYQNDSRYFKIKQAIFINNAEGFVAYFMTHGPGKVK